MSTLPRISFLGANRTAQLRLRQAYARLDATNQQVATGRAFTRPSANAPAASRAAVVQSQLDQLESFGRAVDDSRSRLAVTDTKISQAVDVYQRINQLAVQAANSVNGPESLKAIHEEIVQMRGELQAIGNSEYLGAPLFGGLGTASPVTYNSGTSTWNFSGAPSEITQRQIGTNETVDISTTAGELFSNPTDNIFAVLDQLATDLLAGNNAGIQSSIGKVSSLRSSLTAGQARIGAVANRVEQASTRNAALKVTFTSELSGLQDVDMAEALTDQNRLSVAYQAALGVTAKATERTLLDWLR